MEAIHCSFPSLPISSFLTTQHPIKGRAHLHFLRKQRLLPSLSPPRPQALNEALNVATDTPKAIGGDISVLIPVSALLLFMYWVANFIVPGIVAKDLQKNASEREETVSEQHSNATSAANAAASTEPDKPKKKKKFNKEDIKKMMRR